LAAALDLRPAAARESLGLTEELLRAVDARRCQAIGAAAHYLGFEGIIVPSATGRGTVLAVFFESRRATSRPATPLGRPTRVTPRPHRRSTSRLARTAP
jgi:RES domain-containing protein